jgi:flagellar biosynthetic protein FliP
MDIFLLIRAVAALAITLGLVGLAGVALRKFGPDAMSRLTALRKDRRLQVVETLVLDPTRRLVLFTLDGEERLLMLGEGQLLDWGAKKAKKPPPRLVEVPNRVQVFRGDRGLMRGLLKLITGADPKDLRQAAIISVLAGLITVLGPAVATAQSAINVDLGTGAGLSERVVQMVGLLTVLSLAPSIVIMTTSFVRIVVVLGLLRTAIGVQQSPPNPVIISLALFLTAIVMGPTFEKSYDEGSSRCSTSRSRCPRPSTPPPQPVKVFMLRQVDQDDLALFIRLSKIEKPKTAVDTPLKVVTPAFMISELKRAFEIGFLLFIPFLVIDLVVASVLMSMGMMMLPPATVSLPFKLIFFVLVDGWRLVAGSLVESFQRGSGGG